MARVRSQISTIAQQLHIQCHVQGCKRAESSRVLSLSSRVRRIYMRARVRARARRARKIELELGSMQEKENSRSTRLQLASLARILAREQLEFRSIFWLANSSKSARFLARQELEFELENSSIFWKFKQENSIFVRIFLIKFEHDNNNFSHILDLEAYKLCTNTIINVQMSTNTNYPNVHKYPLIQIIQMSTRSLKNTSLLSTKTKA